MMTRFFNNKNNDSNMISDRLSESKCTLRKARIQSFITSKRFLRNQLSQINTTKSINWFGQSESIPQVTQGDNPINQLSSDNEAIVLQELITIRKRVMILGPELESIVSIPLIQNLIQLIHKYYKNESIVLEILWIFTNFSAGDKKYTQLLHEQNLLSTLVLFIQPNAQLSYSMIDQLSWLVANIALDGNEYKEFFCVKGFAEFFLKSLTNLNIDTYIQINILRALANIIQGINLTSHFIIIKNVFQHSLSIIKNMKHISLNQDAELSKEETNFMKYSLQIIAYICEKHSDYINILYLSAVIPVMIDILNNTVNDTLILFILFLFKLIAESKNDSFPSLLIHKDFNKIIGTKLRRKSFSKIDFTKDICELLCYLINHSPDYLNSIIKSNNLLMALFALAKEKHPYTNKKQSNILQVLNDLLYTDSEENMGILIKAGIIDIIIDFSKNEDIQTLLQVYDCLANILEFYSNDPKKMKLILIKLENSGLVDKLKTNASNTNMYISDLSDQLLNDYFKEHKDMFEDKNSDKESSSSD